MNWVRRHWVNLVLVVCLLSLPLGVWQGSRQQAADLRQSQADACERGNVIREYISFDNDEAIKVLRASLQFPQDLSAREQRARENSLARRIMVQKTLIPFPCETLR